MRKLLLILALVSPILLSAQTPARFDLPVLTTTPATTPPGNQPPLYAVINATVNVCGYPATMAGGVCTNKIETYTDSTLTTACPATAQLTAPGTSACIPTTGLQGALGFWYDASQQTHMTYTVSTKWGNFGPYEISQPGSGTCANCLVTNPTGTQNTTALTLTNKNLCLQDGTNCAPVGNGIQQSVVAPVAGQNIIVYPSSHTLVFEDGVGTGSATNTSADVQYSTAGTSTNGPVVTWSFTLPPNIPAGSVTAIYPFIVGSLTQDGSTGNLTCGSTLGGFLSNVQGNHPLAQYTSTTSYGTTISTLTCTASTTGSIPYQKYGRAQVASVGAFVYYTGAPISSPTMLNIATPLQYIAATNTLGVDVTAGYAGLYLMPQMVANLPKLGTGAPPYPVTDALYVVKDGATATDCTTGGGTNVVECYWNGTAWTNFSSGGSGGTTTNALTAAATGGAAPGATFNGGAAVTVDYHTVGAQQALTLTTSGTSGPATLSGGTLNIPQYTGGGGGSPGGSTGAIQYNNAGAFGGANLTGLIYGNGATAPTAATIAQVGNAFYDISSTNYLIAPQTPTAGWPLPTGFVNNFIAGPLAAQSLCNFAPITTTATASSGSSTITIPSALYLLLPMNIVAAGIPLGDTVTAGSGTTTLTLSAPTTAALSATPISLYPATVFSTTGTAASGSTTLTLPYAFPAQVYQVVNGAGLPTNDQITAISGTTVTLATATTAALSGTPITITPAPTSGLVAVGEAACQSCVSNNGSVVLGVGAMGNFIGDGTGGEDANSVTIGPYSYSGCNGYSPIAYPLFESSFIGNKVFGTGCGAADSQFNGNHINGFYNAVDSSITGGEAGTTNAGVQIIMNRVHAVGDGIFNPGRSGHPDIPAGTYNVSNTNIYGSVSGQEMFNTHDNNVFGTGSMDGGTSANTAIQNDVMGNGVAAACASCSYNVLIGGYHAPGVGTAQNLSTGSGNVIIGAGSGAALTTSSGSTIIGDAAAGSETNATTAIGQGACRLATGASNICIGAYAGGALTTGANNIVAGANNAGGDGPSGAATNDSTYGIHAGTGESSSQLSYFGSGAGQRNVTSLGNNTALGYNEFHANSGAVGTEQYDLFAGDSSGCGGCTYAVSLGHAANIGAVAHATQIDGGTNSTANTMQYQSWNFLDSSGNLNANLLVASHAASAIASAATIAPSAYITHISGTAAISTITPPTVTTNGGVFSGCIQLVPDAAWTLATGGNIGKASTAVVDQLMTVCYDGTTWYPSY